jgi:hypothetical protein
VSNLRSYKLLENAIDSLQVGIAFYTNQKMDTANKHAILNIFHSIELLLKEGLKNIDPRHIFRKPNHMGLSPLLDRC